MTAAYVCDRSVCSDNAEAKARDISASCLL